MINKDFKILHILIIHFLQRNPGSKKRNAIYQRGNLLYEYSEKLAE